MRYYNDSQKDEQKNTYSDGTPKTYHPKRKDLNSYGCPHATQRCAECGERECDFEDVGHYRG